MIKKNIFTCSFFLKLLINNKIYVFYFLATIIYFLNLRVFIGGDDSRLYSLYPELFIRKLDERLLFGYFSEYNPQIFYYPYVLLGSILRFFLNPIFTYKFFFSLNVIIALISTHLLVKDLLPRFRFKNINQLSFLSSIIYVFAPITYYTIFLQPLSTIFALSLFPLLSLILYRALIKNQLSSVLIGNLILIPYSIVIFAVPIILGYVIPLSLLLIFKLFYTKSRLKFLSRIALFIIVYVIFNFFWLPQYFYGLYQGSSVTSGASNIDAVVRTVRVISSLSKPFDVVRLLPSYDLYSNIKTIDYTFTLGYLNYIFILIILFVISHHFITRKKEDWKIILIFIFVLFFTYYLQTVNIHSIGTEVFVILTKYVPGWGMFRNFFNKFTLPFVLVFTICLSYCIGYLHNILSVRVYNLLTYTLTIIVLLGAVPFLFGLIYYDMPLVKDSHRFYNTEYRFSESYFDLIEYLEKNNSGRVISLPLTKYSWSFMTNNSYENVLSMYLGLSPLSVFSNIDDINGKFAFDLLDSNPSGLSKAFTDSLYFQDRLLFDKVINYLNIEYIILFDTSFVTFNDVLNDRFIWDSDLSQTKENIHSILNNNPSYEEVVSFEQNNIRLFKNKNYKGTVYIANYLVSLDGVDNIWVENIAHFINKETILFDKNINGAISADYEILNLQKFQSDMSDISLDLVLPEANINPKSIIYGFVRLSEVVKEIIQTDKSKKIDIKLWHMIKRGIEYKIYGEDSNLLISFNDELTKFINNIYIQNPNNFSEEFLREKYAILNHYLNKLVNLGVSINKYNEHILNELGRKYNHPICEYDYCYLLPKGYQKYSILLPGGVKIKLTDLMEKGSIHLEDRSIHYYNGFLGMVFVDYPVIFDSNIDLGILKKLGLIYEDIRKNYNGISKIVNLKPNSETQILIKADDNKNISDLLDIYELKYHHNGGSNFEVIKINPTVVYKKGYYSISLLPSGNTEGFYIINKGDKGYIHAKQKNLSLVDIYLGKEINEFANTSCFVSYSNKNSHKYEYEVYSKNNICQNFYLVFNKRYSRLHAISNESVENLSPTIINANGYENAWIFEKPHKGVLFFIPYKYKNFYYTMSFIAIILVTIYIIFKRSK